MLQPAKFEVLQLVCERRKRLGLMAIFQALRRRSRAQRKAGVRGRQPPTTTEEISSARQVSEVHKQFAASNFNTRRRPPDDRGGGGEPPARRPRANDAEANTTAAATAVVGAPAIGRNVRPRPNQRTNEGEAASAGPPRTDVIVNCTIS